ncbi:Uncharacterised protein [Corynebacterium ulcerans]|uniref:Transposase n=1 Tax=Corynebacterium ulcerans TaxID=65058 RepID=A0ABD7MQ77_CORUL|nr:Uncharacterised protein [Corynebacterium ulcerans]SQG49871.1 Uncharacterised protein [Corynebacterium ulcerans]
MSEGIAIYKVKRPLPSPPSLYIIPTGKRYLPDAEPSGHAVTIAAIKAGICSPMKWLLKTVAPSEQMLISLSQV